MSECLENFELSGFDDVHMTWLLALLADYLTSTEGLQLQFCHNFAQNSLMKIAKERNSFKILNDFLALFHHYIIEQILKLF